MGKIKKARKAEQSPILFQANALTEARYNFDEVQKNIVYLVLDQLGAQDEPGKIYRVFVKELEQLTGSEQHSVQLRQSTLDILSRPLEIILENGSILQAPIFSSIEHPAGQSYFTIMIDPRIRPLLFDLKNRFTTYGLKQALSLSGKYSKRLYEMLSQYKDLGSMKIDIRELKRRLYLFDPRSKKEEYPNFSDFDRRVIKPALEQINRLTDLKVDYATMKTGRKVTDLRFTIDVVQRLRIDIPLPELRQRLTEKFGLRADQADTVMQRYTPAEINRTLYRIQLKNNDQPIKNIGAYTATAFSLV